MLADKAVLHDLDHFLVAVEHHLALLKELAYLRGRLLRARKYLEDDDLLQLLVVLPARQPLDGVLANQEEKLSAGILRGDLAHGVNRV